MTIRRRLYISFALILSIVTFIIGVFFYTIYNLNEIHLSQNHRYDQIRRVEKLKEHNNSFSWIILDVITDYEKDNIVRDRLDKADDLFKQLNIQKKQTIDNSESSDEKNNLISIFSYFKIMESMIKDDLSLIVLKSEGNFSQFNKHFDEVSKKVQKLLIEEISYLQDKLDNTEKDKDEFISNIKLELLIILIVAFILTFIISTKIIKEIKEKLDKLNKGVLQLFKNDEDSIKVDIGENNELSDITNNLNSYLEKQNDIIYSREELLRNISHELKTPITKGKFLIEKLKEKKDDQVVKNINNVLFDIEGLTSKLLQREKLNFATLKITKFKVSTLILESLSKLSIDDESKLTLEIEDDFYINGDMYYLNIALKNLIDNAMKYATQYPISIKANKNTIHIENIADKLSNDLIYYIQPFTREPNQQQGHGLGLNIVNKIIELHGFDLNYKYKKPYNIFYISF